MTDLEASVLDLGASVADLIISVSGAEDLNSSASRSVTEAVKSVMESVKSVTKASESVMDLEGSVTDLTSSAAELVAFAVQLNPITAHLILSGAWEPAEADGEARAAVRLSSGDDAEARLRRGEQAPAGDADGGVVRATPGEGRRLLFFSIPAVNQPEPGLLDYGTVRLDLLRRWWLRVRCRCGRDRSGSVNTTLTLGLVLMSGRSACITFTAPRPIGGRSGAGRRGGRRIDASGSRERWGCRRCQERSRDSSL